MIEYCCDGFCWLRSEKLKGWRFWIKKQVQDWNVVIFWINNVDTTLKVINFWIKHTYKFKHQYLPDQKYPQNKRFQKSTSKTSKQRAYQFAIQVVGAHDWSGHEIGVRSGINNEVVEDLLNVKCWSLISISSKINSQKPTCPANFGKFKSTTFLKISCADTGKQMRRLSGKSV